MGKCACGTTFQGSGSKCPKCRRDEEWEDRFRNHDWNEPADGDDWEVTQQGLDGESAEGQSTLDGGIQKPRGDER